MEREEMFQKISNDTEIELDQIEKIYQSMVKAMSETLCKGKEVALLPEWGVFIPKEWDNTGLDENSPRSKGPAHYKIRFRPGNKLKKSLVIASEKPEMQCTEDVHLKA